PQPKPAQSTSPSESLPPWKLLEPKASKGSCPSSCPLPRAGHSHSHPHFRTHMRLAAFLSVLGLVLQEAGTASLAEERKRREEPRLSLGDSSEVTGLRNCEATSQDPPPMIGPTQNTVATGIPSSKPAVTRPILPTTPGLPGSPTSQAKLKRLDLSSNFISAIDDDALHLLPALQDLILSENQLVALPVLPSSIELLDVRLNRLRSSGIQPGAFGALQKLQFLYLADNRLDSVPGPLPLSLRSLHLQNNMIETMPSDAFCDLEEHRHTRRLLEDIRLDGNPIDLSLFPSAYFCLPRLPIGRFT
uniref:Opticin n=1 Tax=Cavia porcellus TaxID=10141 RepID=A0A286XF67_CAVPO